MCDCGESELQGRDTALMSAAVEGHADCVRLLIDAGADKEAKDNVRVGRCLLIVAPYCLFLLFPATFSSQLFLFLICSLFVQYILTLEGFTTCSSPSFCPISFFFSLWLV